jgi:hypothetical protein
MYLFPEMALVGRNVCAGFARNGFVLLLTLIGLTFLLACGAAVRLQRARIPAATLAPAV